MAVSKPQTQSVNMESPKTPIRVWCDGCYDLVHFGHANSLRQAKSLGDYLVVGIHRDDEIVRHKGPLVFTFAERCKLVRAIRWVDEVVEGPPYITSLKTLDDNGCDFCCHGDDITLSEEGVDTYEEIKRAGRYREVQRTAGISTTGLLDRILEASPLSPWTGTKFYLTTGRIVQFSGGKSRNLNDKTVYTAGGFDLFHVGHLDFLEKVNDLGDYLIVGVYSDLVIRKFKGVNPVMTMYERVLSLLACKYVDDIVLDPPFYIMKDFMENLKIDLVVSGRFQIVEEWGQDPNTYPKQIGKFLQVDSGCNVTTDSVIERIIRNKSEYKERNERKEQKEIDLINKMKKNTL